MARPLTQAGARRRITMLEKERESFRRGSELLRAQATRLSEELSIAGADRDETRANATRLLGDFRDIERKLSAAQSTITTLGAANEKCARELHEAETSRIQAAIEIGKLKQIVGDGDIEVDRLRCRIIDLSALLDRCRELLSEDESVRLTKLISKALVEAGWESA